MNKMTLIHIGIFTAGVAAGWILAKNAKKTSFANLTASGRGDWNYCTSKCYPNNGYSCLAECMRKRGNPID
jgi:hypothetical protein